MIINLLFIITGFLGFLTLIITLSCYRVNKVMNFYLLLIFSLISIRFLLSGFFPFGYLVFLKEHYITYCKFLILIIPSFYLYFKNLIADQKKFIKADLVHFIFPLIFLTVNLSIVNTYDLLPASFYFSVFSIVILYNITYCFLAYHLLNDNVWAKKDKQLNNKHSILIKKWKLFLFIILIINSIKLFVALFIFDDHYHGLAATDRFQWIGAIVWILTFFKVLISPELLYGYPIYETMKETKKETKKSKMSLDTNWIVMFNKEEKNGQDSKLQEKIENNIMHYIDEIEGISSKFELFSDSKFSIQDLAIKLNIPSSHLNYLFKYHSKISFLDYKKRIRIYRSILLIESNYLKTNTMDSLAKEVGFASYNPFYTSFKNITGISPQKYIIPVK